MESFLAIDKILGLRPVKWGMAVAVIVLGLWLGLTKAALGVAHIEARNAEANADKALAELELQNTRIKEWGNRTKAAEERLAAKSKEAEVFRAKYLAKAGEIMSADTGRTCEEVAAWGVKQGLLQSAW